MEKTQSSKLTINKVAELCGVSKTTISRYLNGKYDNMSAETRERIGTVIAGLDYHPNRTAQRLKAQKSMLIGCVIADVGNPFSALLLRGISNVCEHSGYQVLYADCHEDPACERRAIEGFLENRVDGLLINTTGGNDDFIIELRDKLPVVLVDRLINGADFDSVASPNYESAYNTTKLLLGMGYENIAVITEIRKNITPRVDRYLGYAAAMEEAGLTPTVFENAGDNVPGTAAFLSKFAADNMGKRIAMLCINGVAALDAVRASYAIGLRIGYELGCFTFDDWTWLQLAKPGISAVVLGTEEKGSESARLLLHRIDNCDAEAETQHIIVKTLTVVRDSTVSTHS